MDKEVQLDLGRVYFFMRREGKRDTLRMLYMRQSNLIRTWLRLLYILRLDKRFTDNTERCHYIFHSDVHAGWGGGKAFDQGSYGNTPKACETFHKYVNNTFSTTTFRTFCRFWVNGHGTFPSIFGASIRLPATAECSPNNRLSRKFLLKFSSKKSHFDEDNRKSFANVAILDNRRW